MRNKVKRIILDTNLWVSFLLKNDFSKLDTLLFERNCILVFSNELLAEFIEVTKRPKLRRYFAQSDIENLLETIDEFADFVNVQSEITVCRDPKDNFLLALAIDGNADFLITGDKDLLILKKFGETKIVTLTDFFEEVY